MPFSAWIGLGLIAGFFGSLVINRTGEGKWLDVLLGVVGAVLAGWLFSLYGMPAATGLHLMRLVIPVVGAIGLLVIYHLFFRRVATGD